MNRTVQPPPTITTPDKQSNSLKLYFFFSVFSSLAISSLAVMTIYLEHLSLHDTVLASTVLGSAAFVVSALITLLPVVLYLGIREYYRAINRPHQHLVARGSTSEWSLQDLPPR